MFKKICYLIIVTALAAILFQQLKSSLEKHSYIKLSESGFKNSYYHYYDGGKTRTGIVYVPEKYKTDKKIPLVIILHGSGQTGKDIETALKFNQRADRHGFVALYPDGYLRNWDYKKTDVDDVKFISDLIEKVSIKYHIDLKRVYVMGFSDGAFMAYHLAASIPQKIRAVAAVSGSAITETIDKINFKLPVLHVHGMHDPIIPFEGIESRTGIILPVMKVLEKWIKINECAIKPEITDKKNGIILEHWKSPGNFSDVVLYKFLEGQHNFPVMPVTAEDLICEFFYTYPEKSYSLRLKGVSSGDTFKISEKLKLTAEIHNQQDILRVEFWANQTKISEDNSAPYTCEWKAESVSKYNLSVKAFTGSGEAIYAINPADILILPDKKNIALNKKVKASSVENKNLQVEKAVDGKLQTRWASTYMDKQWVMVDLQKSQKISGITLFWETAHALQYEIQVSDDEKNWQSVYHNKNSKGKIEYIGLNEVSARYVRMFGKKRATPWGFSLWEFMVHVNEK